MNRGAERATGRILLFLHADTDLPPGAFTMIRRAMEDASAAAGAFDLTIRSPGRSSGSSSGSPPEIPPHPHSLRDQAIFIRASCFRGIGGYRDIPIMEDVELMRRIKRRGDRVVFLDARVSTSARRWEKEVLSAAPAQLGADQPLSPGRTRRAPCPVLSMKP
jgi:GT2 family glycosyltransferase